MGTAHCTGTMFALPLVLRDNMESLRQTGRETVLMKRQGKEPGGDGPRSPQMPGSGYQLRDMGVGGWGDLFSLHVTTRWRCWLLCCGPRGFCLPCSLLSAGWVCAADSATFHSPEFQVMAGKYLFSNSPNRIFKPPKQ